MRRVPIRLKLTGALLLPLAALVVVTFAEVYATSSELGEVRKQTELATSTVGPTGLITALQNERVWTAVEIVGLADQVAVPVEGYDAVRAATDDAVEALKDELASKSAVVAEAYDDALAGLDELGQLRADVDANALPGDRRSLVFSDLIFARYSTLIEGFLDATAGLSLGVSDDEFRVGADLADTTTRQMEVMGQLLNTVVTDAGFDGITTGPEIARVATLKAGFVRNAGVLLSASGPYAAIVADHFPRELTDNVIAQVDRAVGAGPIEDVRGIGAAFSAPEGRGYDALQQAVSAEITRRADELSSGAEARQRWIVALAVAVLAAALALTWGVSRSITGPLRSLTAQAKALAGRRLPDAVAQVLGTPPGEDVTLPTVEPVRVDTGDEVADVAAALNTVQDTALDLAVEQAVLRRNLADSFVNLGRRNQNLLSRQLDFITELESGETDPITLQNLFLLDHLATRMRRNAESLLVLADIDPPRQWAAPVGLTDVIRAALGEVEDYQRVRVRIAGPLAVTGSVAADLAHLLAELVENALVFSPAGTNVDIHGSSFDGGYRLAVVDAGEGLSPDVLDAANRRLAGSESFTVAPSKYLGHYVAGRLAARHGIRVWLESMPGSGVIAMVDLPPHLVADALAPPVPPAPPARPAAARPAPAPAAPAPRSRPPGRAPDLTAEPGPDLTAGPGPDLRPHQPPMAPTHKS
jgi:signal transduction histidine kinase